MNISKPTLLNWDKELRDQITELKFLHFEALAEQYSIVKEQRIKYLAELYQKAKQELENRDLRIISTEKLLEMVTKLEDRLLLELEKVKYTTRETVDNDFNFDEILSKTTIVTEYKID